MFPLFPSNPLNTLVKGEKTIPGFIELLSWEALNALGKIPLVHVFLSSVTIVTLVPREGNGENNLVKRFIPLTRLPPYATHNSPERPTAGGNPPRFDSLRKSPRQK